MQDLQTGHADVAVTRREPGATDHPSRPAPTPSPEKRSARRDWTSERTVPESRHRSMGGSQVLFARTAVIAGRAYRGWGVSGKGGSTWCRCSRSRSLSFARPSGCGGSVGRTYPRLTADTASALVGRGPAWTSGCINRRGPHLHLRRCTVTRGRGGDGGSPGRISSQPRRWRPQSVKSSSFHRQSHALSAGLRFWAGT